ncbi:MAG: hypothetical protein A2026_14755 [Deltaproteobacteria bacterium RBG_19FT_COMBO_46_12]|nr:MAG: hypothetical protein A2026_14755 [Deltaproteobacteria bacterium RBG_19FT_COMBO_46_12]
MPRFKNLKEEREFWDTYDSTDYHDDFKTTKKVVFVRPKKEVISLRLEPNFIRRLTLLLHKGQESLLIKKAYPLFPFCQ